MHVEAGDFCPIMLIVVCSSEWPYDDLLSSEYQRAHPAVVVECRAGANGGLQTVQTGHTCPAETAEKRAGSWLGP